MLDFLRASSHCKCASQISGEKEKVLRARVRREPSTCKCGGRKPTAAARRHRRLAALLSALYERWSRCGWETLWGSVLSTFPVADCARLAEKSCVTCLVKQDQYLESGKCVIFEAERYSFYSDMRAEMHICTLERGLITDATLRRATVTSPKATAGLVGDSTKDDKVLIWRRVSCCCSRTTSLGRLTRSLRPQAAEEKHFLHRCVQQKTSDEDTLATRATT